MPKSRFPTREEVLKAVQGSLQKGHGRYVLLIEHQKISNRLGVVKGELFQNGKMILSGKMTQLPEPEEEGFNWDILKNGESYFEAFSLDYKGKSVSDLVKEGLKKSIGEGKLPFLR